jgi:probable phosphoglycerate mutase
MTTRIHLVRHGHHPLVGRVLCGRMAGVALDDAGRKQMAAAAELISDSAPDLLQSSPQQRAMQSAQIIAARCGLPIEIAPAFDEVEMGQWTGRSFADLECDRAWRLWNEKRASTKPPGGESMAAVQQRVVAHIEQLRDSGRTVTILSHAEPIRAALMAYLDVPLDRFHEIEVETASLNTVTFQGGRALLSPRGGEVAA